MWFKRFLAAALIALASPALAQTGVQFPAGTLFGNDTAATRSGKAATVTAILDRALGSTRGAIIERGASGWAIFSPSATARVPYLSGGAGADPLYGAYTLPASVTSGGVACFTSTTVEASSALLSANAIVLGGGAGVCPSPMGSLGTTTTVLHGNAAGAPTFAPIVSADMNITATNCTNQFVSAISTGGVGTCSTVGISQVGGLGTGVATALGVNVGTAGAVVVNGGALGTPSSGVGTNLTGTASGLTAGGVVANGVTRAMEAQGVARSVIGVAGNATANVADIQGTADQVLVVNSAGTALAFGKVNLAGGAGVTGTAAVANGGTGDTGTAWSTFSPSPSCGTAAITTTSGRSKTLGKTMWLEIDFTITAIGSCTASLTFSLPSVTAQSGGGIVGREFGISGKGFTCDVRAASATATCSLADFTNMVVNAHMVASGAIEIQ